MCDYTIKHYWDKKSYGATIEPTWLTSSTKLNREQEDIKRLFNKILLKKYNDLAKNKPAQEKIDGYTIKYTYKDKDDPDPTNNRKVTDITFCITLPTKKRSRFLIYGVLVLALILLGLYFTISYNFKKHINNTSVKKIAKGQEESKLSPLPPEHVLLKKVCSLKADWESKQKCSAYYIKERCKNRTKLFYPNWVKKIGKETEEECYMLDKNNKIDLIFKKENHMIVKKFLEKSRGKYYGK